MVFNTPALGSRKLADSRLDGYLLRNSRYLTAFVSLEPAISGVSTSIANYVDSTGLQLLEKVRLHFVVFPLYTLTMC